MNVSRPNKRRLCFFHMVPRGCNDVFCKIPHLSVKEIYNNDKYASSSKFFQFCINIIANGYCHNNTCNYDHDIDMIELEMLINTALNYKASKNIQSTLLLPPPPPLQPPPLQPPPPPLLEVSPGVPPGMLPILPLGMSPPGMLPILPLKVPPGMLPILPPQVISFGMPPVVPSKSLILDIIKINNTLTDLASKINNTLTDLESKINEQNKRLDTQDEKINEQNKRLDTQDEKINEQNKRSDTQDEKINEQKDLVKRLIATQQAILSQNEHAKKRQRI